jgi:hypothetical protein
MAGPDSDKEMRNVKWWTVSHVTGPDTDRKMREAKRGGQESRDRSDADRKKREVKLMILQIISESFFRILLISIRHVCQFFAHILKVPILNFLCLWMNIDLVRPSH